MDGARIWIIGTGTIVRVTRLIPMSPGDTLIVGRSELPWRKP